MSRKIVGDVSQRQPWKFRIVLTGSLDELLFSRGRLVIGGLAFPELKRREHINAAAHTANQSPHFSTLIRVGRLGFRN